MCLKHSSCAVLILHAVHDELVLEVSDTHVADVAELVTRCMEHEAFATSLVPFRVRVSMGATLGSLEEIER